MKLTLVGLPLGNIEDISLRTLSALDQADLIICEDTRVFHKLWQKLMNLGHLTHPFQGVLRVINEFNEKDRISSLIEEVSVASNAILISDAGMPTFSDPGFHLVNQILDQNGDVDAIPGPTAATTALALSGFSSDKVLFLGFLPKKASKRTKNWESIKKLDSGLTFVLYESPYRVLKTLEEIKLNLGDLPCVAARELTKSHQQLLRGTISELLPKLSKANLKGEFVLLFRF
jgi:16S rRNA (cytidine1402-2'-O)-methyltransferase